MKLLLGLTLGLIGCLAVSTSIEMLMDEVFPPHPFVGPPRPKPPECPACHRPHVLS